MRTLRGGNASLESDKKSDKKESKSSKKDSKVPIDDDVGANGDETTDDEGGVDTPPPPHDDDEDSKEEKPNEGEKEKPNSSGKSKPSGKPNSSSEEADEDPAEAEGEYEVDQIVDMAVHKRRKCPVSFRVRWQGFTEKDDTWLPAADMSCDDLIKDFLEISGRKSEYDKAFEAKKRTPESTESLRQSSRKSTKITYSELDEDQDEILPSGTRTRKIKTKAEKKEMPNLSSPKKKAKKKLPVEEEPPKKQAHFEVEKIVDHRVKGKFTDYKIRWKGYGPKDDVWLPENDLSCPSLIKAYNKEKKKGTKEEKGKEGKEGKAKEEEESYEKKTKPVKENRKRKAKSEPTTTEKVKPPSRSKRRSGNVSYSDYYDE